MRSFQFCIIAPYLPWFFFLSSILCILYGYTNSSLCISLRCKTYGVVCVGYDFFSVASENCSDDNKWTFKRFLFCLRCLLVTSRFVASKSTQFHSIQRLTQIIFKWFVRENRIGRVKSLRRQVAKGTTESFYTSCTEPN